MLFAFSHIRILEPSGLNLNPLILSITVSRVLSRSRTVSISLPVRVSYLTIFLPSGDSCT